MSDTKVADPVTHGRTPLRRRYAFATIAVMAVVAATLSVSFAADSGTSTATVTGSTSAVGVYDVSGAVPTAPWDFNSDSDNVDKITLPEGSELNEHASAVTWSNADSPAWSVAGGSSGTVLAAGAGDLAYLDASGSSSSKVLVSVYVTNMAELAVNYTSWAFNIELHQATATDAGTGSWTQVGTDELVTSDSGTVTFIADISSMDHLGLVLGTGGSFYAVQTDTNNGELGPEFFVRSTQL